MSLVALIDRVVSDAAAHKDELVAARDEWDARAGRVFDDDPLYEERSAAFLEWFALERAGADGLTPIERFVGGAGAEDPDLTGLRLLARTHRSLFRVHDLRPQQLAVDDLLTGCRFLIYERREPLGFVEGDLFEARLCARAEATGEVVLTRGIQHHPREAEEAIVDLATRSREQGEAREEALFRLAKLRWKAARWGHVAPDRIYRGEDGGE